MVVDVFQACFEALTRSEAFTSCWRLWIPPSSVTSTVSSSERFHCLPASSHHRSECRYLQITVVSLEQEVTRLPLSAWVWWRDAIRDHRLQFWSQRCRKDENFQGTDQTQSPGFTLNVSTCCRVIGLFYSRLFMDLPVCRPEALLDSLLQGSAAASQVLQTRTLEDPWTIRSFPTLDHRQEIWHLPRCWIWTAWWCFSISWVCWPTSPSAPTTRGFHSSTLKLLFCEKCIINTSAGSHRLIQGLSWRLPLGAIRSIVNVLSSIWGIRQYIWYTLPHDPIISKFSLSSYLASPFLCPWHFEASSEDGKFLPDNKW